MLLLTILWNHEKSPALRDERKVLKALFCVLEFLRRITDFKIKTEKNAQILYRVSTCNSTFECIVLKEGIVKKPPLEKFAGRKGQRHSNPKWCKGQPSALKWQLGPFSLALSAAAAQVELSLSSLLFCEWRQKLLCYCCHLSKTSE